MGGQEATPETTETTKKKSPLMTIVIVAGIMVAEGIGVAALVMFMGGPQNASASTQSPEEVAANQVVEVELIKESFQNNQTGRSWRWEVEACLKVKQKNVATVQERLERHNGEIRANVSRIVRSATLTQLQEPDSRTLNRQLTAMCEEILGETAEDGSPLFEGIVIPISQGWVMPAS